MAKKELTTGQLIDTEKFQEEYAKSLESEKETWYDDVFKVKKTRFGLFVSETKEGREVITAPNHDACVMMTRFHLKGEQEGFTEEATRYDGTVGGKL